MARQRRTWMRGAVILAVVGLLAGAVVASPLSAAPTLTKKKVKKIATKVANQVAGDLFAARSLWAVVESDGTLGGRSGAIASVKTGSGAYRVTFNRDVSACGLEATPEGFSRVVFVNPVAWAAPVGGSPAVVFVGTGDTDGASVDLPFSLVVHC